MPLPCLCSLLPAEATHPHPSDDPPPDPPAKPAASRSRRPSFSAFCRFLLPSCVTCVEDDEPENSLPFADTPGTTADEKAPLAYGPRLFSYAELYIGSCGFNEEEVLGSGGFGRVYRAVLPSDGSVVAVKQVAGSGGEAERLERSFAAELAAVARLRHRNLVRLRGWCVHEQQLLLVYDYMPNRSLDKLLFGGNGNGSCSGNPSRLGWDRRRRIISGLAAALHYLHEQLDTQIIHRDVKASNVMLDSAYHARLGDFGLARWLEHDPASDRTHSGHLRPAERHFRLTNTSRIGGTIGYLPPESFVGKGAITSKSDVFSFGIVALEVVSGRRAVDLARPDEQMMLLDWMRQLADDGDYSPAIDRHLLDGPDATSDVHRLIHVGLLCSLHDPLSRPSMKWVVEVLSDRYKHLPPLPTFKNQPNYYISFSSSKTTTSAAFTSSTTTPSPSPAATPRAFPPVDAPREITLDEIAAITNNFARRIAEFDFGTGYCGYLKDPGVYVLVKRLGAGTCPAIRTRFADELRNVARLRHRNLVHLRGWCMQKGEMLVVYECSMCSLLARRLFRSSRRPALPWQHRYSIVKSLASAILYLHEEWDEQVIHRNISSSAVFLDGDTNPRLGCFAFAEFLSRSENGQCSVTSSAGGSARGIFGYISPEYLETGETTTKSDVYSFGVVVLEVITGQKAVDFRWPEVMLTKRARSVVWKRKSPEELADCRLAGRFDGEELARLVLVGLACTHSIPESRPNMREVVSILDGNDELLKTFGSRREGKEEWEERNVTSLSLIRRIQAIGLQ